ATGNEPTELERLGRSLQRNATHDILRGAAFFSELAETDFAMAVDGSKHLEFRRSEHIFRVGDDSPTMFIVLEGTVQLQEKNGDDTRIAAYLTKGDFFGENDVMAKRPRKRAAVAQGECRVLAISSRVFRTLAQSNGALLRQLQRTNLERRDAHQSIVGGAVVDHANSTRHVFEDLYQLQMASSLLTIDQDLCVRCGHCTWTCSNVHGVARIVRRGDKSLVKLQIAGRDEGARNLMLPNSCQHCRNPICMVDCPTAAIGRDRDGEIYIRDELCTGCSNCAKACPWDNIQMAPRPKGLPVAPSLSPGPGRAEPVVAPSSLAVKCEQCREYAAPACVSACPTEALLRVDPTTDFRDVATLLRSPVERRAKRSAVERVNAAWPWALGVMGVVGGARLATGSFLSSLGGAGLVTGLAAGLGMLVVTAYAVPKRFPKVWLKRKAAGSGSGAKSRTLARSKLRRYLSVHTGSAVVLCGVIGLHTQMRIPNNVAGATALTFWLTCMLGIFGMVVYRRIPEALTRLERKGLLPEDFEGEARRLKERLPQLLSELEPGVAGAVQPLIGVYMRSPASSVGLVLSGRSLGEEEAKLLREVSARVPPSHRGGEAGIEEVIRCAVGTRAMPARVWLTRFLRAWLPLHMVGTALLLSFLVLHIVFALEQWWA
ncbi:MAG: cyclic nucleotide-binding domain-containing protein, partial [Nannocystaceae bacterium]|nr:cyclic nucleotide-binding domain-containing protein [Nannocystaceae bacterium]